MRCYICSGTRVISVDTWEDGELVQKSCTCVRCQGTGYVRDTSTVDAIVNAPLDPHDASGICICHYPTWGPLGNPRCPAK